MVSIYRPQIITSVKSALSFISPAGTKIAAMIGGAQWGPLNTVETITGISDFINKFGGDISGGISGFRGADLFLKNGSTLKFVRIASSAVKADTSLLKGIGDLIDLTAKYEGTYGNNIKITVTANGTNRDVAITDGRLVEVYNNLGSGYDSATAIIAAINDRSQLVDAALSDGASGADLPDAIVDYLEGGNDGITGITSATYVTAINDVLFSEDFDYLLVPGISADADLVTISAALETRRTTEEKYGKIISGIALDETLATAVARTLTTENARIVAPSITYTETYGNTQVNLDGSYLACSFGGLLCSLGYGESATHKTLTVEDLIENTTSGKKYYNKQEQELALQAGIIPIALIGNEIQVVKDVTRISSTSDIKYSGTINDILDYVRITMENYLNTLLGLPNTDLNRNVWASQCDSILEQMIKDEIITEYEPVVITEGTSQNMMSVDVSIKPAFSLDFIYLNITI